MKSRNEAQIRICESGNKESGNKETRRNFRKKISYKPIKCKKKCNKSKQTYLIFFSLVEYPDLGVVRWVLGNKSEDGFGCGGWWVLFLDESPDLGVLFWVTKGRMGLGGTKPRGCKEGRMGMLCNGMRCKEFNLGCT